MQPEFLNVGQLIEKLQKVDPRASVWIPDVYPWSNVSKALNVVLVHKSGNTFNDDGSITESCKYGEVDLCHDDGDNEIYPDNGPDQYVL